MQRPWKRKKTFLINQQTTTGGAQTDGGTLDDTSIKTKQFQVIEDKQLPNSLSKNSSIKEPGSKSGSILTHRYQQSQHMSSTKNPSALFNGDKLSQVRDPADTLYSVRSKQV